MSYLIKYLYKDNNPSEQEFTVTLISSIKTTIRDKLHKQSLFYCFQSNNDTNTGQNQALIVKEILLSKIS